MANNTASYEFTIIVPVYNEIDNMEALEKRLSAYVEKAPVKTCVLFIDDGSADGSAAALKEICTRHPDLYYAALKRNTGLTGALKAGIELTESPLVGYIDADLQTTPEDFDLLLPLMDRCELAMGIRANRKDSGFKKLQSKIANGFRRSMTGDKATDTGCPLKVMKTAYAKKLPLFNGMHRFLPALFALQDGRVIEVPVRHFPRTAGESKYHLWNRLAGPFMDCFAYRWMRKRWLNPEPGDTDLNQQ